MLISKKIRLEVSEKDAATEENSAVNILMRFLARLGPHTERISVPCADVFTANEDVVNTFEHI